MSGSVELLLTWYWCSTIVSICVQILRIQPGRRCLGSQAKAKQSPRRTERRQKLKKATSRLIMNLIRKMSLSLRAVISSEGHLLRKQKLLSFLVITTDILIWLPVQHYKRTNKWYHTSKYSFDILRKICCSRSRLSFSSLILIILAWPPVLFLWSS